MSDKSAAETKKPAQFPIEQFHFDAHSQSDCKAFGEAIGRAILEQRQFSCAFEDPRWVLSVCGSSKATIEKSPEEPPKEQIELEPQPA